MVFVFFTAHEKLENFDVTSTIYSVLTEPA
jgi:hypothetical protein